METEIKCVPRGRRLVCTGRECSSYQRVEGHQIWKCVAPHGETCTSRRPGSICDPGERQRWDQMVAEIAHLKMVNANLQASCDAYEVRLGREMEHRPEIAEPEVPTLLAANARLLEQVAQLSRATAETQSKILSEVMAGVAEGRVRWDMHVHVSRQAEPPQDDPERVL